MAEVAETGFETFMETESGFEAYVEDEKFDSVALQEIKNKYQDAAAVEYRFSKVEKKNWNEEWEKNYEPVVVENKCLIRAHFHKNERPCPYEIVITPKMSFGTGHHPTTYLMIQSQLKVDHKNKRVMDAGCGTAILSVMASKLGAHKVEAFDIDEWSILNGEENITINNCSDVSIRQGTIRDLSFEGTFDIILANINKRILLDDMSYFSRYLSSSGYLLLSGFYTHDIPDLLASAKNHEITEKARVEREGWAALLLCRR